MGIFDIGDKRPRRARMGLKVAKKKSSYCNAITGLVLTACKIRVQYICTCDDDYITEKKLSAILSTTVFITICPHYLIYHCRKCHNLGYFTRMQFVTLPSHH